VILPVAYAGEIKLKGRVEQFVDSLDPQRWEKNAPEIWLHSYLIGPSPAPPGSLPLTSRAAVPPSLPRQHEWGPWSKFYEEVTVVGLQYRNVLETRLGRRYTGKGARKRLARFEFEYRQFDCLTTESVIGRDDGGIDVDYGSSVCEQVGNQVHIKIGKTVRYTAPSHLYGELNGLSHVLTPLVFDGWLHHMLFGGP
jgi:hypothetical protein